MIRRLNFIVCIVYGLLLFPRLITAAIPQDSSVIVDQGLTEIGRVRDIVRDSRGWLYAVYWTVYAGGSVYCSRSTDNGRTWVRLARLNPDTADFPTLAIDRGDTLYVTWRKQYIDTLGSDVYLRKYNGTVWSPPLNVSNQHAMGGIHHFNDVVVDGNNHPHVVWDYNNSLYHRYHDGTNWTAAESLGPGIYPCLSPDTGSAFHLVYINVYVPNDIAYRRWSSGGWGPEEAINDRKNYAGAPCIVGDFSGIPHVTWTAGDSFGAQSQVFYTKRQGGAWLPSWPITRSRKYLGYSTMSCDLSNNLYVAYQYPYPDTSMSHPQVFYTTFNGLSWSPETLITTDTTRDHGRANLGYPVTANGVDLLWTTYQPPPAYLDSVVYLRLPLVGSGVEQGGLFPSPISRLTFSVVPNPFVSHASVPGHAKERFSLYDVAGRKVGVYQGDRVGLGLSAGVYFLKPEGQDARPLRIVKLR